MGLYYYDPTDDTSFRGTVMVNAASTRMLPATAPPQKIVIVQTVEGQKNIFTWHGVNATTTDRCLQHTMMIPCRHKTECTACDGLIQYSPVTPEHLTHANHIYGPDVIGIKGKGTKRKIPYISVDITKVLPLITSLYRNVTSCGDVLFFNKVVFFGAISLNI